MFTLKNNYVGLKNDLLGVFFMPQGMKQLNQSNQINTVLTFF
jgi:hypothetical protein